MKKKQEKQKMVRKRILSKTEGIITTIRIGLGIYQKKKKRKIKSKWKRKLLKKKVNHKDDA